MKPFSLLIVGLVLVPSLRGGDAKPPLISDATKEADGILVHRVESEYQDRPTLIRVLLPSKIEKDKRYPVLYVLPVEAGTESRYGDGLQEVRKLGLQDKYSLICVLPTFARLPWYADHPTNKGIRQESYLLKVVVPFVEEKYPAIAKPEGRLLLGFSKSGWGAFTLLLRHPDTFAKAAAWDAPLDMDKPGKYGSGEIFGTEDNFRHYHVTKLLEKNADQWKAGNRLVLTGYGNFRESHRQTRTLLAQRKIPHDYRDGPSRKHDWHSGWVAEAVELLVAPKPVP